MKTGKAATRSLNEALARSGLRLTRQRQVVYEALTASQGDHPTADELFHRVKKELPGISLATVYNCLEKLVERGLIRQVNRDRDSTRYCGNLKPHAHFYCNTCGTVHDVDLPEKELRRLEPPAAEGYRVEQLDINFRGLCPKCHNRN